ncbi:MAG: MFS transporter [Mailhella sp.]|nr:MFS transporter [Mailhella sp.]
MAIIGSPSLQVRIFGLITGLCVTADAMLYAALPVHLEEAGLSSLFEVGLILSMNRLIRLPANPAVGRICAHVPPRACMLAAVILSIAVTAGYAFASGLAAWLFLRACWGIAWAFLRTTGMIAAVHYGGTEARGRMIGIFNGTWQLGGLAGMTVGALAADTFGMTAAALVFVPAVAAAIPCWLLLRPVPRPGDPGPLLSALRQEFSQKSLLAVFASAAFTSCLISGLFASSLGVMVREHLASGFTFSFAVVGAATIAGTLIGLRCAWEPVLAPAAGRLADRFGPFLPYGLFGAIAGPCPAAMAFTMPVWAWLAAVLCFELCATALASLGDILVCSGPEGSSIQRITACTVVTDLGAAAGPALGFLLADLFGLDGVFIGAGAALLLTGILWMRRGMRQA